MVVETVTGAQIPLDAAYIANLGAQNNLSARGQDIDLRGQDIQMSGLLAQFEAQGQQALQEYYNNVAQFGLQKAEAIYTSRLAKARMGLEAAAMGGEQRGVAANLKLETMKALADRSGPQDWVGYSYMLDKLGKPSGTNVDPFSWADSVVDPRLQQGSQYDWGAGLGDTDALFNGIEAPQMAAGLGTARPNFGNVGQVQPWQYKLAGGQPTQPVFGGGASLRPGTFTGSGNSFNDPRVHSVGDFDNGGEPVFSGVRNEDVAGMNSGDWRFITTGLGGSSRVSDYSSHGVYRDPDTQYAPDDELPAGTPIWLRKLARGGSQVRDVVSIVGDEEGKDGLGEHGELLINYTGAPFDIVSHEDAEVMLGRELKQKGKKGGPRQYGKGTFLERLAKYAGGTFIDGQGLNQAQLTPEEYQRYLQYRDDQATIDQLRAAWDRGASLSNVDQAIAIGAGGWRPANTLNAAGLGMNAATRPYAGMNAPMDINALQSYLLGQVGADGSRGVMARDAYGNPAQGMAALDGVSFVNGAYYDRATGSQIGGYAGGQGGGGMGMQRSAPQQFIPPPVFEGAKVFGDSAGTASDGGAGSVSSSTPGATQNADGTWSMPETPVYTQYSPEVIGDQPWMKALKRGQRGGATFGAFGSKLSSARLGIDDAPSNINVQGFRDMDNSQRQAVGSLYSQGLAVDFNDILGRAQKAAPAGVSTGAKRYGR